ncbi:MAG: TolC family protein, partial [Bacteroidales bacterium]|nr:TolC family protein [Bacteroidales bacterium]
MNCELKRMVWVFVVACLASGASYAQQKVVLDLERTVRLATDSSLTAQKYQSVYDISRYQYLSWIATRKPQISLEATPFLHERYMTQRYLSFEDIDEYRMQQDLYSQAGITITQAMEPWGGEFYGSSKFGYLHTFGE